MEFGRELYVAPRRSLGPLRQRHEEAQPAHLKVCELELISASDLVHSNELDELAGGYTRSLESSASCQDSCRCDLLA